MDNNQLRGWLIISLLLIGLVGFTSQNYTPRHSIYNEGEFGTSALRESLEESTDIQINRLLISPFGLANNDDIDFMVIIGSERAYTEAEVNAYVDFVDLGGTLIIFEDFGQAREIAEAMGISYFEGVLRERNDNLVINRPTQFLVQDFTAQIFGLDITLLLMVNEAAAISDIAGLAQGSTLPLLLTSSSAFVDKDNDNAVDREDFASDFGLPVGLLKPVGGGFLGVISDASIPLNIHHERTIEIQDTFYPLPNILWSSYMLQTVASLTNSTSIVFDESHQEILLSSSSGLINLIASTWVGIFNSGSLISFIFGAVILFGLFMNRDIYKRLVSSFRRVRESNVTANQFVSNPTLVERGLSEQFILYQRMGTEFIHIANLELYSQIEEIGRSDEFLEELTSKYGSLTKVRSAEQLLEIHQLLREHVATDLVKWL